MFHPSSEIVGFDDEDAMMNNMTTECTKDLCHIVLTVSFTNLENEGKSLPKTIKYTIRDTSTVPGELHDTAALFPKIPSAKPREMKVPGMLELCPCC